jgi:hypothetical protein
MSGRFELLQSNDQRKSFSKQRTVQATLEMVGLVTEIRPIAAPLSRSDATVPESLCIVPY